MQPRADDMRVDMCVQAASAVDVPDASVMHIEIADRQRHAVDRARARFAERFRRPPRWCAMAPGRVNLIGEHTDYNHGFVLPIALERETIIVADGVDGDVSTFVFDDVQQEAQVDLRMPLSLQAARPANYLLGVASQFQQTGVALANLDVVVCSSVPLGAGLASSAALGTAWALLLAERFSANVPREQLAWMCRQAEHAFAGTPCGIMDMFVALLARPGYAMLLDCHSQRPQYVPADFAAGKAALLVVDSGVKHDLASGAYADRRASCEAAARIMHVSSLREATIESLNVHDLSPLLRRRALHVIAENTRTILAAEALALRDWARMGELMFQSHASLRDLYEVSCEELDVLVNAAAELRARDDGVYGARMTGGGFGGCVIVLCEATARERIVCALRETFAHRFDREPSHMFCTSAAGPGQIVRMD